MLGVGAKALQEAFLGYEPSSMRLTRLTVNGVDIVNDAYNSNPLSMRMALEAIRNYPARARWVVSGDMLELGKRAARFHEMVSHTPASRPGDEAQQDCGNLLRHQPDFPVPGVPATNGPTALPCSSSSRCR
jgi:UDP-N-acetylmuramyl pentapeptide synthase